MRRVRDANEPQEALRRKFVEERQLRKRKQKTKTKTVAARKKRAEIMERRQMQELKHASAQGKRALELLLAFLHFY